MDSPVCCWERSLSWCTYPVHNTYSGICPWIMEFYVSNKLIFLLSSPPCHRCPSLCSQLLFVVGFTVFLANCVDYDILFANKFVNHTDSSKLTLPDAFLPVDVCSARWVGHCIDTFCRESTSVICFLRVARWSTDLVLVRTLHGCAITKYPCKEQYQIIIIYIYILVISQFSNFLVEGLDSEV